MILKKTGLAGMAALAFLWMTAPVAAQEDAPRLIWTDADTGQLLQTVKQAGSMGLNPRDYQPEALEKAISSGDLYAVSSTANRIFSQLVIDIRDGRTPASARRQWYIRDDDADYLYAQWLLDRALSQHSIASALKAVEPIHPDYAALKAELDRTPASNKVKRNTIRVNLDRWRWLPRNLGKRYILVNVPEFKLRLVENGKTIATHRIVVGKSKTPTPQLDVKAQGVILNPNWYVPRSILAEGLGHTIRTNPAAARAKGYAWTGSGSSLSVRQLPGPRNALGQMKLDMRNPYSIFIHDTPSKHLFERSVRAFSHGCIRTHEAVKFAKLLAQRYADKNAAAVDAILAGRKTTRLEFAEALPIYISYFTASFDAAGNYVSFKDIYGRDRPVIQSLDKTADHHLKPDQLSLVSECSAEKQNG
jgi:L,D-transpeptidase YcbB